MADLNPRSLFRLAIALFGLYSAYNGANSLFNAVLGSLPLTEQVVADYNAYYGPRYWAVRGLVEIVFGIALMAGVFSFENLAFPFKKDDNGEQGDSHDVPPP